MILWNICVYDVIRSLRFNENTVPHEIVTIDRHISNKEDFSS